jgi:RNA polymerase sigma-70 factor (ECF subfamily)
VIADATAVRRTLDERELAACRKVMFRFAMTIAPAGDAEDIVQDALARAWQKRRQYDPARGSLQSWLLALVADQARARRRRPKPLWERVLLGTADHDQDELTRLPSSGRSAGHDEAALDLRAAVQRLAPRQRATVVLHHFVDLPIDDVAALLQCSPGTVKSTLHDARRALARILGESYAD